MPISKQDLPQISQLATSALLSRYLGNKKHTSECLNELGRRFGWAGVAQGALSWARMAQEATGLTPESFGREAFMSVGAMNMDTGEMLNIDELDLPESMVAALRIFTCCGNSQYRTAADLLASALDRGIGSETVTVLLRLCVEVMRPELDKHGGKIRTQNYN